MPVTIKIEGIFPPKGFMLKKGANLEANIRSALQYDVTRVLSNALLKRTANWSVSPRWEGKVSGSARIVLNLQPAGPGSKLWRWVSGGTDQHPIQPKRRNWLKFESGYVPKTLPKGTYGQKGTYIGGTVFTKFVDHPGIEPRAFEDDVVDEKGRDVHAIIAAAVNAAVA